MIVPRSIALAIALPLLLAQPAVAQTGLPPAPGALGGPAAQGQPTDEMRRRMQRIQQAMQALYGEMQQLHGALRLHGQGGAMGGGTARDRMYGEMQQQTQQMMGQMRGMMGQMSGMTGRMGGMGGTMNPVRSPYADPGR